MSYYEEHVKNFALAVYDAGWRSKDRRKIQKEYGMDNEWTDAICEKLKEYEEREREIDEND